MLFTTEPAKFYLVKQFKLVGLPVLLMIFFINISEAQYYWVGGNGNWSDYSNHWATTSGGATFHSEAPTTDDDVYFDANSFAGSGQVVTLDQPINYCKSMDWTGVLNFPSLEKSGNNDLYMSGSLILAADMSCNFDQLYLVSNASGNTLTFNGVDLGSNSTLIINGNGEYGLNDNLKARDFTIHKGTFNTNGNTLEIEAALRIQSTSAKTVNLGSSDIYCQQWRIAATNLTLNTGTSTLYLETMYPDDSNSGPYTYNNVIFKENSGFIKGSGIFNIIDANNTKGEEFKIKAGATVTCNQFILNADRFHPTIMELSSGTGFATLNVTSGTVEISYVIMKDIHATGGATFNVNPGINKGNNDGWNFTAITPLNFYWVGNGGDWEDMAHWSSTSGGSPDVSALASQFDNVFFDANSFTTGGQTVELTEAHRFNNMDWTGANNNPTLIAGYQKTLSVYGNLTISDEVNKNINDMRLLGEGIQDLYFGNQGYIANLLLWGSGTYNFNSGFNGSQFSMIEGILNLNSAIITLNFDFRVNGSNSSVLNFGSAVIFCDDFEINSVNATVNAGTSEIHVRNNFKGKGNDYYHVVLEENGSIFSENTFEILEFAPGVLSNLEAGMVQTVNGDIIAVGSSIAPISISSTIEGEQATLSKSSGTVNAVFVNLKDNNATGGATFNAVNAIDNGNNTGWNITPIEPHDFYWVGGSGNWSDAANHWATSSGGNTFYNFVPGALDDVHFDSNSFTAADQEVVIDIDAINTHTLDWSGATNNPMFTGLNATVNIYGSLMYSDQMQTDVRFYNFLGDEDYIIDPGAGNLPGDNATFSFNAGGSWTLEDSLVVRELFLENGTFNTGGQGVHVDFKTVFLGAGTKVLNLGTSMYYTRMIMWEDPNGDNLTLNGMDSKIICSSLFAPFPSINGSSVINLNDLHFSAALPDVADIHRSFTVNNLSIDPGKEIRIFSGVVVTVNQLIAQGTEDDFIYLHTNSVGNQGTISQVTGTVNGLYLELQDMNAIGGAEFFADFSIDLGNVTGWIFSGQSQTIDFPPLDDVMEDIGTIELVATASSGLEVQFEIISGPATVDGNLLTITGAGQVQVKANQPGDIEYNPAPSITNTFCSIPLKPVISGEVTGVYLMELTSSSENGNQWFFNGNEIADATGQIYEATENGTYSVLVDVNGCVSEMSDNFEVTVLSVPDLSENKLIKVYPNPVSNKIYIETTSQELYNYRIYNLSGKLLLSGTLNEQRNSIGVSELQSGVYILKLDAQDKYYQVRVIKN